MNLAYVQLIFDISKPPLNHAHKSSLAARAIANSTSPRLVSYCYDEVFRLAEGQLTFALSNAVRYNPTSSVLARSCLLESPIATAGFNAHITGSIEYFGPRQRMFANAEESVCALVVAAAHFVPLTRRLDSKCTIHPPDALLPHEIAHFFSALSYHFRGEGLLQTLATELKSVNRVQLTVYTFIIDFLYNDMEIEQGSKFGIKDINEDTENEACVSVGWWRARKEWCDLRNSIIARCRELEISGDDLLEEWPWLANATEKRIVSREAETRDYGRCESSHQSPNLSL